MAALLLCSPPAPAQDSKARSLFVKGRYLVIKKGDCLRALIALEQARDLARSSKLRGDIYLSIAHCNLLLGDDAAAQKALRQALLYNPRIAQYAKRFKPDMQLFFREVQRGTGKKPSVSGSLSVVSLRKGALVLIDGEQVGVVPYMGRVAEGRHRVVVRTPDGEWEHGEDIVMVKGGIVTINATLKKVQGTLTVKSSPPGARVYINKEIVGSTPVVETPLPPGAYTITVRKDGFKPRTRKVKVRAHKLTTLSLPLKHEDPLKHGYQAPTRHRRIIWTWVAAGGALAALVTGVGLGLSIKKSAEEYAVTPENKTARLDELEASMRREAVGANVMFGVSGALLAASVVLFFWEGGWFDRERPRPVSLTPSVGDGTAGILWTVEF